MNAKAKSSLSLVFKAVALGMAVVSIVLTMLNTASPALYATLLSLGLFCLAIAAISDRPEK